MKLPSGVQRRGLAPARWLLVAGCWSLVAGLLCAGTGCVRQLLTVKTTPPGATVYFNGQLLGHSPLTHEFLWYERYHIRVEKAGYPTLQHNGILRAPVWMWFPLDGIMACLPLPLRDRHSVAIDLEHPTPAQIAAAREPLEVAGPTHTGVIDDLRRIHQKK